MQYIQNEGIEGKETYSFFTNEYVLTKEICGESEWVRIDIGIAYVAAVAVFIMFALLISPPQNYPGFSELLYQYFSSPSPGDVLEFSGVGIRVLSMPVVLIAAAVALVKCFPKLVGEKRYQEQIKFVPSAMRRVDFYNRYVEVSGKFSKKLPYAELRRTGETRNLYILFFTEKRMLILHKAGFRKGSLSELKDFIKKHRTSRSKAYSVVRWLPVFCVVLLFMWILWEEAFS